MIITNNKKIGHFLFKYRGQIPVPLIILGLYLFYNSKINTISDDHYILCLIISLSGLIVRILTVGFAFDKTSGKNTKGQVAESLNTTGIYSLIRNPLYLANYLNWLGVILLFSNIIVTITMTVFFFFYYYYIIIVEEDFLIKKFKEKYKIYFENTPRFIPSLKNWKKPVVKFNFYKSVVNIKNGLLGISIIFYLIFNIDRLKKSESIFELNWIFYLMIFSLILYVFLKIILKLNDRKN